MPGQRTAGAASQSIKSHSLRVVWTTFQTLVTRSILLHHTYFREFEGFKFKGLETNISNISHVYIVDPEPYIFDF